MRRGDEVQLAARCFFAVVLLELLQRSTGVAFPAAIERRRIACRDRDRSRAGLGTGVTKSRHDGRQDRNGNQETPQPETHVGRTLRQESTQCHESTSPWRRWPISAESCGFWLFESARRFSPPRARVRSRWRCGFPAVDAAGLGVGELSARGGRPSRGGGGGRSSPGGGRRSGLPSGPPGPRNPAAEIRIGLRGMVVVVAVGILVAPHPVEILHRRPVGLGGAVDRVAVEGVGDRAAKASAMSMAAAGLAAVSRNGTLAAASLGAASAPARPCRRCRRDSGR